MRVTVATDVVAVPFRAIVCVAGDALVVTVTVAARLPADLGVNAIEIVQEEPAKIPVLVLHPLVSE